MPILILKSFLKKNPSWYGSIQYLLKSINKVNDLKSTSSYKFKTTSNKYIREHFLTLWNAQKVLNSQGKLDTYCSLKSNFGLEKYLVNMTNFESRRNITRLRISAHRLNIERGRYQRISRENRKCTRCDSDTVDDEKHFVLSCSHIHDLRLLMLETAESLSVNFTSLSSDNKLFWLLNNENITLLTKISDMMKFAGV